MTEIQEIFNTQRCRLWKPLNIVVDPITKLAIDFEFPEQPTYENVPVCLQRKGEFSQPAGPGRYNRDLVGETFDVAYFAPEQQIGDGWLFQLQSADPQQQGEFWGVVGDPEVRPDDYGTGLGYCKVSLKHGLRGPNVVVPSTDS